MEKLKCYLVDDEISALENMQAMLTKYCPNTTVIGSSTSVQQAALFLSVHKPDVLFLDIQMQNETGFDLMRLLPEFDSSLIFVTAHDEYGLQAIKFSATDYLLKPIDANELIIALHKAHKRKDFTRNQEQISMLIDSFEQEKKTQQKKIALPDAEEIQYINIEDIIFCKSSNTYTVFHIVGASKITVSKAISEYEVLLQPYHFIRIHQSYLINKNKIQSFKKEDGGCLYMEDGSIVPVSRQRKHLLKNLF